MLKTIVLKPHDPILSIRIGQEYPNHLHKILVFSELLILGGLKNMSLIFGPQNGMFFENFQFLPNSRKTDVFSIRWSIETMEISVICKMRDETIKFPKIDKVIRQDKVTPIYGIAKPIIDVCLSVI